MRPIAFAALLLFRLVSPVAAADLCGTVTVVDGDTIDVGDERVRLLDVDAPELAQTCEGPKEIRPCGRLAAEALQSRVEHQGVCCIRSGKDEYGRTLARCSVNGEDLSTWLVLNGWGMAFVRYSRLLVTEEAEARRRHVGIWAATHVEAPWEYRHHKWDVAAQKAPKGCPIKGNIGTSGERIYHMPWDPWYARTKINLSKGERWFCSEAEAIAAGWRAPRHR
jgi:endonuclease YncB( thermonuclease family)